MRFLVVDDAPAIRLALRNQLLRLQPKCVVDEAESGREAAERCEAGQYDCIFTGLGLRDGRAEPYIQHFLEVDPNRPIVLCTSLPRDHPDVGQAMALGCFAYMQKPVRGEAVAHVLRELDVAHGRLGRIK